MQLILAEECHFDQVADSAGGSWYVEKLTADLAEKAWGIFQDIEAEGGVVAGLQNGQVQERVAAAARARQDRLATGKDVLVGTNKYANPLETPRAPRVPDYRDLYTKRSAAMTGLRTAAAHENHLIVLKRLEKIMTAETGQLFSAMVEAAAQGATLGELTGILRHDADRQNQVTPIPLRRDAEPFEKLRSAVQAARKANPQQGRVFCACLGDFAGYMPRLDFVRGFFQAGGFEVIADNFFTDPDEVLKAVKADPTSIVIIVGQDKTYGKLAVPLARKLMATTPEPRILLAGMPGDLAADFTEAGISKFIHVRSNILEVVGDLIGTSEVRS